ncbi:hypothetical protein [Brevundimonas sp. LjRoot202]|uniref:hypothetical protein n=1 Tax=Brevundimonas sp. LjRoot202 TaxID=3342281 RepID=UPI003ED0914D
MSDRLAAAFDFRGRLSFVGHERLTRKLLLLSIVPVLGPMFLLIAGAPRLLALTPLALLVPLLVAFMAAHARRMHDLNQHAYVVHGRRGLILALAIAPALTAFLMPGLPDWAILALPALSLVVVVVSTVRSLFVAPLEWRRGDPGPNRFGPAPE